MKLALGHVGGSDQARVASLPPDGRRDHSLTYMQGSVNDDFDTSKADNTSADITGYRYSVTHYHSLWIVSYCL